MQNPPIDQLLFIDIETVAQYPAYDNLPDYWQELWMGKTERFLPEGESPGSFYEKRAAIMAEFGKVICISAGYLKREGESLVLKIKSFSGDDECLLLKNMLAAFNQWQRNRRNVAFCGHNIREFDIPYLCRRLLINGLGIPPYLDFQAMKPWETNMVDTLQLWKFGDYKHYTSLNLLAACMGVPSPKNDIDGSQVGHIYWQERDLPRIVSYCQKDVVTVAQLILRFRNLPLLAENQVLVVEE